MAKYAISTANICPELVIVLRGTFKALLGFFKYTSMFVPLSLVLSPWTGVYAAPWPPATMLFVFYFKGVLRLAIAFLVSLLYSVEYIQQRYNAGLLLMIKTVGMQGIAVALLPLFVVTIASLLAVFFADRFSARRFLRALKFKSG